MYQAKSPSNGPAPRVLSGRYRLDSVLASSAVGEVHLATQLGLERQVAVKLISRTEHQQWQELVDRLSKEAQVLARLNHVNVVTLHDFGRTDEGDFFLTMEYLNGRPLAEVIEKEGPLPFDRILKIAVQIARALREAHAVGVIHRDLTSEDVFLVRGADENDRDHVKVINFGLADSAGGANRSLEVVDQGSEAPVGSPSYTSPEQICGDRASERSDIYSFGVLLYLMGTGRVPFSGGSSAEILRSHLKDAPPPPTLMGYRRRLPRALEELILRCLEKEPDHRFQNARELILALKAVYWALDPSQTVDGIPKERGASGPGHFFGGIDSDSSTDLDPVLPAFVPPKVTAASARPVAAASTPPGEAPLAPTAVASTAAPSVPPAAVAPAAASATPSAPPAAAARAPTPIVAPPPAVAASVAPRATSAAALAPAAGLSPPSERKGRPVGLILGALAAGLAGAYFLLGTPKPVVSEASPAPMTARPSPVPPPAVAEPEPEAVPPVAPTESEAPAEEAAAVAMAPAAPAELPAEAPTDRRRGRRSSRSNEANPSRAEPSPRAEPSARAEPVGRSTLTPPRPATEPQAGVPQPVAPTPAPTRPQATPVEATRAEGKAVESVAPAAKPANKPGVPAPAAPAPVKAEPAKVAQPSPAPEEDDDPVAPSLPDLPPPTRKRAPQPVAVIPPQPLRNVLPTYPDRYRSAGYSASVTVKVTIDTEGTPSDAEVIEPSRYPEFNFAAKKAALRERYQPATQGGAPVRFVKTTRYNFAVPK